MALAEKTKGRRENSCDGHDYGAFFGDQLASINIVIPALIIELHLITEE